VNEDLNPQQTETDTALRQLDAQLTEKSRLLQATLTSISQGILVFDAQGRVDIFNPRVCELLDLPERLLASRPTVQALTFYQRERGDFGQDAALIDVHARNCVLGVAAGAREDLPSHYLRVTPAGRTLEARTQALPEGVMVRTFTDVTDYVQAQATLQKNEERWKLALESTGDGVWDWHIQSGVEFYSKRLLEILGYDVSDVHLQARGEFDKLIHPDDLAQLQRARQAHFDGLTPTYSDEHRVRCKDGSWKWMLSRGMVISRDAQGLPLRMIGTHTDVTERKRAEALIWQQAHFDTLTGLPNRRMLRDRMAQEIKRSKRDGLQLAVLFIDLDHFKEVNDTLGHDSGDRLLMEAARRISDCVRESDTVARMGGDEFAVILTELLDASSLERMLQKILQALEGVFQLDEEQAFVSAALASRCIRLMPTRLKTCSRTQTRRCTWPRAPGAIASVFSPRPCNRPHKTGYGWPTICTPGSSGNSSSWSTSLLLNSPAALFARRRR
jgi:diguanylate cyclase (GGDEF)-like protein/PAS domain S-box-containing protein